MLSTKSSTVFIIGQNIDVKEGGKTEPTEVGQDNKSRVPDVNIHNLQVNKGQPNDNKHDHGDYNRYEDHWGHGVVVPEKGRGPGPV